MARGAARRFANAHAPELFVVILLAATGAAFVHTEREKLKPSPLAIVAVDEEFAPLCGCASARATISLELRAASDVSLAIVDEGNAVVRTLLDDVRPRGGRVVATWDGRDDAGRLVPDAEYRPRLHVARERRTFLLTTRIRVDTKPPVVSHVVLTPRELSRRERSHVDVRFRVSERAQPLLYVGRRLALTGWWRRAAGKLEWYGRLARKPLPPGSYRLRVAARDEAGNLGRASAGVRVRIRGGR